MKKRIARFINLPLRKSFSSNHILKASAGILIITLAAKVLGYGEKLVLAYFFGTTYQVDVYNVILTIVLSFFVFFREIIEPGYLNVFLKRKADNDEASAWNIFNRLFLFIFIITFLFVLVIIAFPSSTVEFFAPGFDNEKKDLAVKMLPIAIPAIILLSLSTITNITLNALKKFVVPASAELIFKGLIIAALILLYKQLGIYGIAIGVLAGALGKLLLHLILLRKHLSFKMKQGLQEKESLMQVWYLTWPLLLGVLFSQASGLIDNMFASFLREGSISALSYAKKVVELPVLFFPYIISIVIFPYFSQLAIEKNMDRLKMLFGSTIQVIAVIFIPLSIFIGLFSTEIIRVVFERGAFDQLSTQMTSLPLFIYSFGLLFFAIETILVILFFSMGDTKTPILVGILCVILNLGLTYSLIEKLGYIVIALAYVVQKFSKNIVLLFLLKKKVDYQIVEVLSFLKTIVFASLIFFAVNFYFKKYFFLDIDNKFILVLKTFSTFILSGIVYFVALKVLRFKLPMNALKPNIQSNS